MILGLGFAGLHPGYRGRAAVWETDGIHSPAARSIPSSAHAASAPFPMAGRLSAKMAQDEDFENFILMHAIGSNTAGQLASVIAGGLLLTLVTGN